MPPCFSRGIPGCGMLPVGAPPLPMRRVRYAGRTPGGESRPAGNMQRCMLCQKNLYLHEHKHYHYESIAYKRQPPQGGEHFYRLVRGCPDARSGRHRGGDRPHRTRAMQGCIACGKCAELGHCVFSDAVYTAVREKLAQADGLVVGSPVYYAGRTVRFARCSTACFIRAAAIWPTSLPQPWLSAAVAGASATFDRLNKYFTISNMPVVSSAILEQRTRTGAARSARRCRRLADDAGAGDEHGATAEGRRRPPSGPGTRRTGVDAFHPLTAAGLDFRMEQSAQKRNWQRLTVVANSFFMI